MDLLAIFLLSVAMVVVGLGFILKHKTPTKDERAEDYAELEERAKQGDEKALYDLLMIYYNDKDKTFYPLAFRWALSVAHQEYDSGVMLQVADMYYAGDGIEQSDERALFWYEKALKRELDLGEDAILSSEGTGHLTAQIHKLRNKIAKDAENNKDQQL
ncbi:TPR repeat protein [Elusimicrobium simillimum]|uniref:hypothetical protein n=1 Tax=Elusimicrobium simillimum TaxID=3143438 RepID=UPI003C6EF276